MTKLYIPALGDELRLTATWGFKLFAEHRNKSLFDTLKVQWPTSPDGYYDSKLSAHVALPAGAVLKVDRIYIRRGQTGFDSVTFMLKGEKTKKRVEHFTYHGEQRSYVVPSRGVRFWAKLADVNTIEFDLVAPATA